MIVGVDGAAARFARHWLDGPASVLAGREPEGRLTSLVHAARHRPASAVPNDRLTLRDTAGVERTFLFSAMALPKGGKVALVGRAVDPVASSTPADPRSEALRDGRDVRHTDRDWPTLPGRLDMHAAQLVGQKPLREIVRDATAVINRVCIETALKRTKGSRVAAARLLGLSRQGLYSKLALHGIEPQDGAHGEDDAM